MFLTTERKVKASFTGDERRWQTNEDQTKQILELTGRNPLPFSEEEWYQILSGMVTVMTALWIWLKNEKKEGKK